MTNITRRDFIGALLASSALYATAGSSAFASEDAPKKPGKGPFDVAIIGAGMAGLSAARELMRSHKKVVVLEARDYVGGRAHSINNLMRFPVNIGAEWLQFITANISGGPGTNNPLFDTAFGNGGGVKRYGMIPDLALRDFYNSNGSGPVSPLIVAAAGLATAGFEDAVNEAGNPLNNPIDVPTTVPFADFHSGAWANLAAGALTAAHGPTLAALGCRDFYNLSQLGDPPVIPSTENWLIRTGLGNLVAGYGRGVPIKLKTPVKSVTWNGNGVQLTTEKSGTVQAKTVIVTVPTGVLASGGLAFNPGLDSDYTDAFEGLPMSQIEKVFMRFKKDVFGPDLVEHTMVIPIDPNSDSTRYVTAMRAKVWGQNVAEVLLGGNQDPTTNPTTAEIAAMGPQALIDFALSIVTKTFPSATSSMFVKGVTSTWITSPYSLGAYSYAPSGNVPMRAFLADNPIGGKIFFAGEATRTIAHSSVPGAYLSGIAAADAALPFL